MKKIVALILFIVGFRAESQELRNDLDSLLMRIDLLSATDTMSINLRNDYAKQALFANPADGTLPDFAQETLENAKRAGYQKGIMVSLDRLALIHQYALSNPYKALDYYHQALSIAEKDSRLFPYKWGFIGGIATLNYEQEEYAKALHHFREILENSTDLALTATANIANVYGAMKKTDSAIFYYRKALTYEEVANNPTYEANLYSNLSLMYENSGDAEASVNAIEKSLNLINRYGIEFVRPTAYANASMAFLKAGDLDKAKYYADESLKLSDGIGNPFLQKSAWGTLADVYAARGEYQKALEAHIRFSALRDSLNNQNRRVEINRKQMEFDFENERIRSSVELKRQTTMRQLSTFGGLAFIAMSIAGFVMYKRRRDALAKEKEAEFKALVSDTELKALRLQMNPHFIFNSLNSIGDYMHKNETSTAQDYLTRFAALMRMTLENSEFPEIALSEDLKFIELYLQVESKRLPGRFSYAIEVDESIDIENTLVPPLILQPLIENSIWHGFKSKDRTGHILIEIKKEDEMIVCSVDDNGSGRNMNGIVNKNKRSLGIRNTKDRISIINTKKRSDGALKIIDKANDGGTRVEVRLPLQTAF
jgi:tetratricopeptide (TPR) repeat protein